MKNVRSVKDLLQPELVKLTPYRSPCFEYRIKMDLNESPFDLPPELKEEVSRRVSGLNWQRYHDEFEEPLKIAVGGYVGFDPKGILIGNGSNEIVFHTLLASVRTGDAVVCPEPSFSLYRQNVTVLGGRTVPFSLSPVDFSVDPDLVIDLARRNRARAVVLCSPNNPTGNLIPNEVIGRIAGELDAVVAVDEAYTQFAEGDALGLLAANPNLVLMRTFSKAFGLAGLRFGFSVCAPELAAEIAKVQLPHHVNFITQLAALTMLGRADLFARRVEELKRLRDSLQEDLRALPGVKVYPSQANFVLIELAARTPQEVFDALLARGILVRNISNYPGLSRCLRFTVGRAEDNRALVSALAEVLG